MPITFNCACGKTLRVADEHAGKRVKCPACNAIGTVPGGPEPEPVFEVVENAPKPAKPFAKPSADDEEEGGGGVYGLAKPNREEEDDEPRDKPLPDFRLGSGRREADRRARKKKKK
jgi:hypothetical protein